MQWKQGKEAIFTHIKSYIKQEERFISNQLIDFIHHRARKGWKTKVAERSNIIAEINET